MRHFSSGPVLDRFSILTHMQAMAKDDLYQRPRSPVPPFEFDDQVARVFDDMINRSIPFYGEIIDRQVQLIDRYYQRETTIYDLGCSNGNLGLALCRRMGERPFTMKAVDNSAPMLSAYRERLETTDCGGRITLLCQNIGETDLENASVVVLNFTLQFLPEKDRSAMIYHIYKGLNPGGVLLFSEKITHADPELAKLQQDFYYTFKRENGYSEMEISQKREALEKILIPETLDQHMDRLQDAGFAAVDVWQKWFNFASLIAIK
jgi:tRNA (cmo5U34)-methyltransferase